MVVASKTAIWSEADCIARFAGFMALMTSKSSAFTQAFMNADHNYQTGKSNTAVRPDDDTSQENDALYETQKKAFVTAMKRIYLVYPEPVDPCFGLEGEVYAKGEIEAAGREERKPQPKVFSHSYVKEEHDAETGKTHGVEVDVEDVTGTNFEAMFAPQPVIFASITTDAREGMPNAKNRGFDYKERGYPLEPQTIRQLKKVIGFFNLEDQFPAFAHLHEKRETSKLDCEIFRKKAIEELGPAPFSNAGDIDAKWLKARSEIPFGKVWLQDFDADCPAGKVIFGTTTPVLVPLKKDRARDRNGSVFLDVDRIDRSSREGEVAYQKLNYAVYRWMGKAVPKNIVGKRKVDEQGGESYNPQSTNDMLFSLEKSTKENTMLLKQNADLAESNNQLNAQLKKLKTERHHLVVDDGTKTIVDLVNADATLVVRCGNGKMVSDNGNPHNEPVMMSSWTVKIRFQSDEDDLPKLALVPAQANPVEEDDETLDLGY